MRRLAYIVCYDISDEKRVKRVFHLMRSWGDHIQLSVFRCEIDTGELERMRKELMRVINCREDQVLIIPIGPPEGENAMGIQALGRQCIPPEERAVVV